MLESNVIIKIVDRDAANAIPLLGLDLPFI
jgi:hypothetical protein